MLSESRCRPNVAHAVDEVLPWGRIVVRG
jgi:hypothetical protein